MPEPDSDPLGTCRYTEGCHALRHYSLGVLRVRTIAVAQGFALLTAASYFVREGDRVYAMAVAIFGLAFTAVLYSLQVNYWRHFEAILRYVTKLEAATLPFPGVDSGPWSVYEAQRDQRFGKLLWKILNIHGPYLLLISALIGLLVFSSCLESGPTE